MRHLFVLFGASDGNRTRGTTLGRLGITIIRRLRAFYFIESIMN